MSSSQVAPGASPNPHFPRLERRLAAFVIDVLVIYVPLLFVTVTMNTLRALGLRVAGVQLRTKRH